jgi:hypothetical protein
MNESRCSFLEHINKIGCKNKRIKQETHRRENEKAKAEQMNTMHLDSIAMSTNFDQSVLGDSLPKKGNSPPIEKDAGRFETCEETLILWGKRAKDSPICHSKSPFSMSNDEFGYSGLLARKELIEKFRLTLTGVMPTNSANSVQRQDEQHLTFPLETLDVTRNDELVKRSTENLIRSFDSKSSKKTCCTCKKRMCLTFYCPCLRLWRRMCLSSCSCPGCKNNEKFAELREHVLKELKLKYPSKNTNEMSMFQVDCSTIEGKADMNGYDSTMIYPQNFLKPLENQGEVELGDFELINEEVASINRDYQMEFFDDPSLSSIKVKNNVDEVFQISSNYEDKLLEMKNESKPRNSSPGQITLHGQMRKRGRKPKNPQASKPQRTRKNDSQINRNQRILQLALKNDPVLQDRKPFI